MTDEKTDPQSQLKCLYASLEKTVSKFDPEMQEKMNIAEQNFIGKLRLRLKDLDRENCGIVLTGEVSAGKTMLMNLLVGKRIMKPANHPSTKNVYRIHNRKEFKITYSTIEGELIHQKNYETEKALLKELRDYKEEKKCIDIFLPLPSLKGNIVLIDTPGVGYTSEYDNIIKAVIPHAVAFVFVANLGSAGGFQEGRLLKIINDIENQIGQMPCFDQHDVIFLMNKYDQVGEHEREEVMNNAVENLHKVWPYVAFAHENMMFISLKEVSENKKENQVNKVFQTFQETLEGIIEKNANKRFKEHRRYLEMLLKAAITTFDTNIQWQRKQFKANELKSDAQKLRQECSERVNDLSDILKSTSEALAHACYNYVTSEEVAKRIIRDSLIMYKDSNHTLNAKDLLRTHFIQALESWCSREPIQTTINRVENEIEGFLKHFEQSIENILSEMTGKTMSSSAIVPFNFKKMVEEFANRLPKATAFRLSLGVNIKWLLGISSSEERLKKILEKIISECSYVKLAASFKEILFMHFIPRINSSVEAFLKSLESIDEILLDVENIDECSATDLAKMEGAVDSLRIISQRLMLLNA